MMDKMLERVITEPLQVFLNKLIAFLPNLFSALIVLIFGLIIGRVARFVVGRGLHMFKLDEFADRSGIQRVLARGGVRENFSSLIAHFISWVIVLTFLIIALGSLDLPAIERLLEKFFLYLPNIFVSIIIVIIGYMLSNFFARAALIASVNAGLSFSGIIGKGVKLAVFLFSLMIAFEHLGIGRETIVITFAIIFGGVVFALSLAFGLGGKDIARDYIEKRITPKTEEEEPDDIQHL